MGCRVLTRQRDPVLSEPVALPSQPPYSEPLVEEREEDEPLINVDWEADLEDLDDDEDDGLCVICLENPSCVALAPCGHITSCESCTESVLQRDPLCPLCRTPVTQTLRIYR